MSADRGMREGDWVRIKPLWPGVWRIARVLSGFRETRWSLDDPIRMSGRTIVFCHRLLNDSWKRSFSFETCEASLVESLSHEEREHVNATLDADTKLRKAFEKYQITHKSIDLIANVALGGLEDATAGYLQTLCDEMLLPRIANGVTFDEVLGLLREGSLEKHVGRIPKQRTLQLTCINHELRGEEFVYRRFRTLDF